LICDHSRANHLVSSLTLATSLDQLTLFYTNRPVPALSAGRPGQVRLPWERNLVTLKRSESQAGRPGRTRATTSRL